MLLSASQRSLLTIEVSERTFDVSYTILGYVKLSILELGIIIFCATTTLKKPANNHKTLLTFLFAQRSRYTGAGAPLLAY